MEARSRRRGSGGARRVRKKGAPLSDYLKAGFTIVVVSIAVLFLGAKFLSRLIRVFSE